MHPVSTQLSPSLYLFAEALFAALAIALSLGWSQLGHRFFSSLEARFTSIAARPVASLGGLALAQLGLRLLLLPVFHHPLPVTPNDFSYLFSGETFAFGRLTNPTPAQWFSFETIHISMVPTWQSMYFPAQGLLLALGQRLLHDPWLAQLLITSLMCAAICWALRAWVSPAWAFVGGLIAVVHLGLFSYWINSFQGASLFALAGALVLGGYPRLLRAMRLRDGLLLAIGIAILIVGRPYEGLLLCLPFAVHFLWWLIRAQTRPAPLRLLRATGLPVLVLLASVAWLGVYDRAAFGHATTLPYTVNRAQYAIAPYYVWQQPHPEPAYRHPAMRSFYAENELPIYTVTHNPTTYLGITLRKFLLGGFFYFGFALLPALVLLPRVVVERRLRLVLAALVLLVAGLSIEIYLVPHYIAPFTAVFYLLLVECLRRLRQWHSQGQPAGLALSRLLIVAMLLTAAFRVSGPALGIHVAHTPVGYWTWLWYGPDNFGQARDEVVQELMAQPGRHLVLVRYRADHNPIDEWVYNHPDLADAPIIWAHEMSPAENQALAAAYPGRQVWRVEPDSPQPMPVPYTNLSSLQ